MGFFSNIFNSKSKDETPNQSAQNNVKSEIDELIMKAESGDVIAQGTLSDMYFAGKGVEQNYQESIKWLRKAADGGLANAQFSMGLLYCGHMGMFQRDIEKAIQYFMKAAVQGHPQAENEIGNAYYYGSGMPKNMPEAEKWYQMAVQQGEPNAMVGLSQIYFDKGRIDEAIQLISKSASLGNAVAMDNLAFCYMEGKGIKVDKEMAVYWLKKSVDCGYAKAFANLAYCYMRGEGIERDYKKMFELYKKGAELGDAKCIYRLGCCYKSGIINVVDKDLDRASELMSKAMSMGYRE
jgi:TPR repeat protein